MRTELALLIDPDPRWAQVDYDVDPKTWAAAAAERLWANTGQPASRDALGRLAIQLAALVPAVAGRPVALTFFVPEPWDGPTAALSFSTSPRAEGDLDDVLRRLLLPGELLSEPAERSAVDTKAGAAVRLRQRYVEPGQPGPWELALWAWWLADLGVALVANTTFLDPLVADRWIDAVDSYVSGVQIAAAEESA